MDGSHETDELRGVQPRASGTRPSNADLRNVPPEVLHESIDIQEQDRRLVAYEIHDGLAQQLTGTLYRFQAFQQLRERSPEEAEKAFREGMELLTGSVAEVRRLINGLRPPILDEHGIVDAIDYLASDFGRLDGLEIEFVADFPRVRLASNLETMLYRIAQESLSNVRKHSRSDRAQVALRLQGDRVLLTVRDWGVGFDPRQAPPDRLGLRSISDRAALVGGHAEIHSAPGKGTEVVADLPFLAREKPI